MRLDHTNLRKTLRTLDKTRVIELFCNRNVASVCSLFIFTQILKADLFKYQIEFKELEKNINFLFTVDNVDFELTNDGDTCHCERREIVGISSLYKVIKSMDFLKVETVWPIAVCFAHYKIFLNEKKYPSDVNEVSNIRENRSNFNENKALASENRFNISENNANNSENGFDNSENRSNFREGKANLGEFNNNLNRTKDFNKITCEGCNSLQEEIFLSVRMLNNKFEGLFIQKKIKLDFLSGSTLFLAVKNDLRFLHDKKLFYNKNGNCDRKIGEFLARWGISIGNAKDPYNSLDFLTKRQCTATFGEEDTLIYKNGHDIEITAVEHSFLILFYLYKEKDMFSYMCLEKRKLLDVEKVSKFYEKIVSIFKDSVLGATKAGNLAIFKVKSESFTNAQISAISYVLHRFLRIYLQYRNESHFKICISFGCDELNQFLYSEDFSFDLLLKSSENFVKSGENLVKIEKKLFVEVIRDLAASI